MMVIGYGSLPQLNAEEENMGIYNRGTDGTDHGIPTVEPVKPAGEKSGIENVKQKIADKLHNVAGTLHEKTRGHDTSSGMGQYGKEASQWLDQTADYVRDFDYHQGDAQVREYVKENPGRSLLIAGGVGLILGAVLRRR